MVNIRILLEKGGTLFRPVAKTRGRQSAEPASQTSDNFNNTFSSTVASSRNAPPPGSSMLPPSFIPQHSSPNASDSDAPSRPVVGSRVITPMRQMTAPSKPSEATAIAAPSRRGATPLVVGQSRRPPTISRSTPLPPSSSTPTATGWESSTAVDTSMASGASMSQFSVLPLGQTIPAEEFPPFDDIGSSFQTVYPETTSHPQKRGASAVLDGHDGSSEAPAKKPRRTRTKKPTSQDDTGDSSQKPKRTRKRRNIIESEGEGSGNNTDTSASSKRTRQRSSTATTSTRTRKSKGPTLPPYDPDAPGVDLDPTAITMANLCKDTGQGRVSSKATEVMHNHIAWKAANREKRTRMIAVMEAKKFGRNLDQEEEEASHPTQAPPRLATPPAPSVDVGSLGGPSSDGETVAPLAPGEFDYSQTMSSSRFNVQVRIGPNGETIVDEESLFVDTNAEQDTENYTHVEESDTSKFINSATHSKKYRGSRWSTEETELFYDVRLFLYTRTGELKCL